VENMLITQAQVPQTWNYADGVRGFSRSRD
jgi:hypothetical protein